METREQNEQTWGRSNLSLLNKPTLKEKVVRRIAGVSGGKTGCPQPVQQRALTGHQGRMATTSHTNTKGIPGPLDKDTHCTAESDASSIQG